MADKVLYKDITKYSYWMTTGELPYLSDRTIANYKKMRFHPMCTLGLNFTTLGLTEVPRVVECENEEVRVIVDVMLGRIWKRLLRDAFESLFFGFKPFEIRYEPGALKYKMPDDEKERTFSGILLRQPKALDAEYVRILVDDTGGLRGFKQDFSTGEVLVEDRKCLIVTHQFESGNYYGISAMEPIYSSWYISSINMQFHTRWLERKGTGLFLGRYPVGKQDDGTDNAVVMNGILDSIMEGTTIALPAGYDENGNPMWDISILDAGDKTDAFIQFHEYLDKTILRGLVIPERALTQGEVGARASVEAYSDIFMNRKQDILDNVVDHINKYLVPNFVALNWGDKLEVTVSAGRMDDRSKANAYALVEKLVEKDRIEVELEWLIEKTGIPLTEKEAVDIVAEVNAKMGIKKGEEKPEEEEKPTEKVDGEKVPEDTKKEGKEKLGEHSHQLAEADRWASMTARESKFDLSTMSSFLTARSEQFQNDLRAVFNTQRDRIKAYLEKNIGTGKAWAVADEITIQPAPIKRLYKEFLNDVYAYGFMAFQRGVESKIALGEEVPFIGFRTSLSSGKLINDLETAIKHAVSEGITRGAQVLEIVESFTLAMDAFMTGRIANIAETEIGFTTSKANEMYLQLNKKLASAGKIPAEKKIDRFQYSAIMDDRVCPLCEKLDSTIVNSDSPIRQKYNPPLHYMCRCIWMPITAGEIADPRVADTDLTIDPSTGKPYTSDAMTALLGGDLSYRTFK